MSKQAEYSRRCYQKYKEKRKQEIKLRRKSLVDFVNDYKRAHSCVRCGESEICCLDFHHVDPTTKAGIICFLARRGVSLETLMSEILKCEILCANCHRKHHYYGRVV